MSSATACPRSTPSSIPDDPTACLGTYAVLKQIREARRLALSYLYLGYWIGDSRKMRYKDNFRPLEAWDGQGWQGFERGEPVQF
jgi:arginyl-tRNA--protein-N-Asp/Glu arginylyltransferase